MWITKKDYTTLVEKAAKSITEAAYLTLRVNQLERELGHAKYEVTGRPQPVPIIHREATLPPDAENEVGETSFEDMGDELARIHGIT